MSEHARVHLGGWRSRSSSSSSSSIATLLSSFLYLLARSLTRLLFCTLSLGACWHICSMPFVLCAIGRLLAHLLSCLLSAYSLNLVLCPANKRFLASMYLPITHIASAATYSSAILFHHRGGCHRMVVYVCAHVCASIYVCVYVCVREREGERERERECACGGVCRCACVCVHTQIYLCLYV